MHVAVCCTMCCMAAAGYFSALRKPDLMAVCHSMLQRVAARCSALQCVAVSWLVMGEVGSFMSPNHSASRNFIFLSYIYAYQIIANSKSSTSHNLSVTKGGDGGRWWKVCEYVMCVIMCMCTYLIFACIHILIHISILWERIRPLCQIGFGPIQNYLAR